ncbi:MAG: 1,2-phenylacetyl-CoA epoxidase, subunit C [Haliscomenobacter sp.]|nr:1,2-phenylacetyl-CoA epoxidase, subunit C [Haliscomenobacter sp.]
MNLEPSFFEYLLRLADNALILGQRQSEWCGHGPVLEQDIALTNIALDQIGQARMLLAYAGKVEGKGRTEDALAFLRDAGEFRNLLLVEQPNEDWGYTILRQFFFDAFNFFLYQELCDSADADLAVIAQKAIKEITYHLRFSSEWVIRLGDGTDLSHRKMQEALADLWMFTGEMFLPDSIDEWAKDAGIGPDLQAIHRQWNARVREIFEEATLDLPESGWMQQGGKQGIHTEHLGYILADMQFLQRAYPGLEW